MTGNLPSEYSILGRCPNFVIIWCSRARSGGDGGGGTSRKRRTGKDGCYGRSGESHGWRGARGARARDVTFLALHRVCRRAQLSLTPRALSRARQPIKSPIRPMTASSAIGKHASPRAKAVPAPPATRRPSTSAPRPQTASGEPLGSPRFGTARFERWVPAARPRARGVFTERDPEICVRARFLAATCRARRSRCGSTATS